MKNPFIKLLNICGLEIKAAAATDTKGWFYDYWGGSSDTEAGVRITNSESLTVSAVFACMKAISEDVAKLPIGVFKKLDKGRETLPDHPLYEILNTQPNIETFAMSFRNAIIGNALSYGNGYAEIVRDAFGVVTALWLINPERVTPKRDKNNKLYYQVTHNNGKIEEFDRREIFHVPGFGFDGVQGYNVISLARQSIGLARGAEKFGAEFFGNGAKASLVLEMPQELSTKSSDNLIASVQKQVGGNNKHGVLLAEQGSKFKTLSLSQKDSQYLETRQFSIPEICRWFRIQPHKVFDLTKATFSNIEEQNTDYVTDALMPWFVRFEQAVHCQLLTPEDRLGKIYIKHNANALMRGDAESRADFYNKMIISGVMTRNEARELEEMNPLDGLDAPLMPLNMVAVGEEPIQETNEAFVDDIAGRITTAEERGLSARVDRADEDRLKFNNWVASWYNGKHADYVLKVIEPIGGDVPLMGWIVSRGYLAVMSCENPAEHIKTWNRKQEIKDIINEALLCTHK